MEKLTFETVCSFENDLTIKYPVDLCIVNAKKTIVINKIIVKKECRKQGVGTKVIKEIQEFAKKYNTGLSLVASAEFGATSLSRLKRFYKSLGFVENKGRKVDYEILGSMYWFER